MLSNCHSHPGCLQTIVGASLTSLYMFLLVAKSGTVQSVSDLVPFAALTVGVLMHMPFSVGCHLFCCIDATVARMWYR